MFYRYVYILTFDYDNGESSSQPAVKVTTWSHTITQHAGPCSKVEIDSEIDNEIDLNRFSGLLTTGDHS